MELGLTVPLFQVEFINHRVSHEVHWPLQPLSFLQRKRQGSFILFYSVPYFLVIQESISIYIIVYEQPCEFEVSQKVREI